MNLKILGQSANFRYEISYHIWYSYWLHCKRHVYNSCVFLDRNLICLSRKDVCAAKRLFTRWKNLLPTSRFTI